MARLMEEEVRDYVLANAHRLPTQQERGLADARPPGLELDGFARLCATAPSLVEDEGLTVYEVADLISAGVAALFDGRHPFKGPWSPLRRTEREADIYGRAAAALLAIGFTAKAVEMATLALKSAFRATQTQTGEMVKPGEGAEAAVDVLFTAGYDDPYRLAV